MRFISTTRLADLWDEVHASYWLVPALIVAGSVGLAVGMAYVDWILPHATGGGLVGWAAGLQADAARSILSTLAGSMATIVGIVFSITIVALQLGSSQFGPHVLRTFLTDRGSQVALGGLLGTFTYSLLVIIVVRGKSGFVPYASTYTGIVIGIIAIGILIYYINHIAKLMRVENLIAAMSRDIVHATETVFPESLGSAAPADEPAPQAVPACFASRARTIEADDNGYIRRIDEAGLIRMATDRNLLIRLDVRPGDFIIAGMLLMAAAPAERLDAAAVRALRQFVVLGPQRTPEQDVAFALQRLEEIAIRALSPGINAPFTAIPAIDQIGAALCRLAKRRMPSPCRRDKDGNLRVLVMRPHRLIDVVREALDPVAANATGSAIVMARVVEAARQVAARATPEDDREALQAYAAKLAQVAEANQRSDLRL